VNIPRKPFSNCYADDLICTKFKMENLLMKRMVSNHLLKIKTVRKFKNLFKRCDSFVGGRVSQKNMECYNTPPYECRKSQNLTSRGQKIQSKTVSIYLLRYWHYFVAINICETPCYCNQGPATVNFKSKSSCKFRSVAVRGALLKSL